MEFRTLIDVAALRDRLGTPRLAILDCRYDLMKPDAGREAYAAGHIPGARYVDLNQDLSAPITARSGRHPLPPPDEFARRLSQWGVRNDTQVVAYDDANGSFAARLWWMLRWLGHASVAVLDGGFKAWVAGGGAQESSDAGSRSAGLGGASLSGADLGGAGHTGVSNDSSSAGAAPAAATSSRAEAAPAAFLARVNKDALADAAAVVEALRNADALLTDARAAERFAGSVEPIDAVAGHVPGAVNHPFTLNIDASGHFLPAAELRRRWQERLADRTSANLIAMCGSGVTACHNLLSLEVAGLGGGKLYAGSWSEWIRDPTRPVARG